MSVRQAIWQTFISRAGTQAAEPLELAAAGESLATILRRFADRIEPRVFQRQEGHLPWQFLRSG
jgi:hypothetical protein